MSFDFVHKVVIDQILELPPASLWTGVPFSKVLILLKGVIRKISCELLMDCSSTSSPRN